MMRNHTIGWVMTFTLLGITGGCDPVAEPGPVVKPGFDLDAFIQDVDFHMPDAVPDVDAASNPDPDVLPDAVPDVTPDAAPDAELDTAPDAAPEIIGDSYPDTDTGTDTTSDASDPDVAPDAFVGTCGDGTCDATETNATCPQDCTATGTCGDGACDADETAVSCPQDCYVPVADFCFAIVQDCMFACADQACFDQCGVGKPPAEVTLAMNMYQCYAGCAGPTGQVDQTCVAKNCIQETIDCQGGGTWGDAKCPSVIPCVNACGAASAYACIRGCYSAATEDAATDHQALLGCAIAGCIVGTSVDQACAQTALTGGGDCAAEFKQCNDPAP